MILNKYDNNSAELCAEALKSEKLVIIPTDTVYGFSTVVKENASTAKKIIAAKGRDENKPFIQLIASPLDIFNYTNDIIPDKILKCWPGPLTIIVTDKKECSKTIAFRCPGDDWLRKVIALCGCPIYSTSANKSGEPILEKEEDLISVFGNVADLIVLDGNKKNGLPSTLIKIENEEIKVLRQGELKL